MSALGQKQTYAVQKAMSALPPVATSIAFFGMSALGHWRTFVSASWMCPEGKKRTSQRAPAGIHATLEAYGVGPIDQPRLQTHHHREPHSYHTGHPLTDSIPSGRTNRGRPTVHYRRNNAWPARRDREYCQCRRSECPHSWRSAVLFSASQAVLAGRPSISSPDGRP